MNKKLCFYVEGETSIVDTVKEGTVNSFYFNESLEKIRERYPKAEIVPYDYALERIDETLKEVYPMLEPKEITKEQYEYAIEVLPPVDWVIDGKCQSFKMSEHEYGNITTCYAKLGNEYYSMYCRSHTPHETIINACKAKVPA